MLKRVLFIAILLVLVASIVLYPRLRAPDLSIPEINTTDLHPLVVEAIEGGIQELKSKPDEASAWGQCGMILMAHGITDSALECLKRAAEIDPKDFRWPYYMGYLHEDVSYDEALSYYSKALQLRPAYIPTRLRISTILMRLGKLEACAEILSNGRKIDPDNPYLLVTLGRLKVVQNEIDDARDCFETASKMPQWMPQQAYLELVRLSTRAGDHEQAYEYQRKLSRFPDIAKLEYPDPILQNVRKYEGLSKSLAERADFALSRGDVATAISEYERFVAKRSDLPNAYTNLAHAYTLAGRHEAALETYQHVLNEFGPDIRAHIGLAGLYEMSGQFDLAKEQYLKVIKLKPDHFQAWLYLGSLYEQRGDLDEALRCYQKSIAVDPSFPQGQLAVGVAFLKKEQPHAALPFVKKAALLAPEEELPRSYLRKVEELLEEKRHSP